MIKWLRLVRFPNLVIVALTQYLLAYLILYPPLATAGINPLLDSFHFFLLVLVTVLLAAGGYVINDIEDLVIDQKNKPETYILGRLIAVKSAFQLYYIVLMLGLGLSLYVAIHIKNIPLVLIYPIAAGLLYWYSRSLKKSVLWGNVVVAIFCAFVAGILWFAERAAYGQLNQFSSLQFDFAYLFGIYMSFAFVATLLRELIKDIEDRVGDVSENCRTFPIVFGLKSSKYLGYFYGLLLMALLFSFFQYLITKEEIIALFISTALVLFPLLVLMFLLKKASIKEDFTKLSKMAKFIMLGGLLMLIVMRVF